MSQIQVESEGNIANLEPTAKKDNYKDRLKHSNWYITINTNKVFNTVDHPDLKKFTKRFYSTLESIFENNNILGFIKLLDDKAKFNTDFFKKVTVQYTLERGDKNNSIHAHVLVAVSHRTKISLDYTAIKEVIKKKMELDNIYFLSKMYRSASHSLEDYLNKDVKY